MTKEVVNPDLYQNFKQLWNEVEGKIERLQSQSYDKILSDLLTFIRDVDFEESANLQTAVLLTGVNQADHLKQFGTLSSQIANNCSSIVTILTAQDCPNLKSAVEHLVGGLINDEDLKKKQLTFPVLESWYRHTCEKSTKLVVMIADFEQFNTICIQDLINILCCYANRLPLILVVGVATAFKTLHNVLPAYITNKLDANVFQSESSTVMLNKILDEIILTHHSPFQLSGKSFKILMDIFLFYDYSLHSFIKGYKIFMFEHFLNRPLSSIFHDIKNKLSTINPEHCAIIRSSCFSFRNLVDATKDVQKKVDLITNDKFLKSQLQILGENVQTYFYQFHCCLRILVVLLDELPRNNLGKLTRELYPICISSDVTKQEEYKECFKMLKFTSKDIILSKLDGVLNIIKKNLQDDTVSDRQKEGLTQDLSNLVDHREKVAGAGMSPQKISLVSTPKGTPEASKNMSRQEMMMKLQEGAKNNPTRGANEYERLLWACLDFLNAMMQKYLKPIDDAPALHEFFIFTDYQSVRRQILGAPRGALHNALMNSHHYLQCSCCVDTEYEGILRTIPDTAAAYKLHLECNKFINLYDWLQSFSAVIDANEDEDEISEEIQ